MIGRCLELIEILFLDETDHRTSPITQRAAELSNKIESNKRETVSQAAVRIR
jgi:hypothetical protein